MLIEQWADKQRVDIACVTETHLPHSSAECANAGLYVEDERVRGDWKWFFSSGVDPKHLEQIDKIKKGGGKVLRNWWEQAREHDGLAIMVHRQWWHNIVDVRPEDGRTMTLKRKSTLRLKVIAAYAPHAYRPTEEK